jgi:hypothetical protein
MAEQELNDLVASERKRLDAEMSLEEAAARSAEALREFQYIPSVDQIEHVVASPNSNLRAALERKPVPFAASITTASSRRSKTSKSGAKKKRTKKLKSSASKGKTSSSKITSASAAVDGFRSSEKLPSRRRIKKTSSSSSSSITSRLRTGRNETRLTPRTSSHTNFSRPQSSSTVEDTLRIRELEHEVALLHSEAVKVKSRHQRQLTEAETKSTLYGAQVDRLAHQIEALVARNADTSAQKVEADMNARDAQDRVEQLENNSATLRKLLTELLGNPSEQKVRSMEEQHFWDQIATPEIMAKSRPPSEYVVPSLEMVQAHPIYSQELDAARARLRITDQELKRVKNELESLQKQLVGVRSASSSRDSSAQAMIARQRKWLMGTVRRIKWVIKKRTETEAALKDRDVYVGKLETKLLHQAMTIRKQRSAIRAGRGSANNTRSSTASSNNSTKTQGPRTVRGSGKKNKRSENLPPSRNVADDEATQEARASLKVRAENLVGEIAQQEGPPSPHLRKTLSSIMSNDDLHHDGDGPESFSHRVAAVPMSPLKSPAPKKRSEDIRSALDVLAEDDDGEFNMEDIAVFTQTVTSEIFNEAVAEAGKKAVDGE